MQTQLHYICPTGIFGRGSLQTDE